jgi:hypothetical protein
MAAYSYILSSGTIVPDTAEILGAVQTEYKNAFGAGLVVTPNTPQGLLITAETSGRSSVAINNADVANQINPNLSGGIFLKAVCALTGFQIPKATSSYVTVDLAGVSGTIVPAGSTVKNSNGDIFASETVVVLTSGTVSVVFSAIETGPIAAPAGTLTQIVNGVLGWETATNPLDAVLGTTDLSDASIRLDRRQTLAQQGMSLAFAILSNLRITEGVRSASFRENVANTTEVIDGITMVPHSLYACVDGGTDLDVATVFPNKKSGGCNYNSGASATPVTVDVTDPSSGQIFEVSFDRPDLIGILVRVTARVEFVSGDPTTLIKQAINDYAEGLVDGEEGFAIGVEVSAFELSGAINFQAPGIFVTNLEISLESPVSYSNATIPIALWEKAFTNDGNITVVLV